VGKPFDFPCKTTHLNVTISLFRLRQAATEIFSNNGEFYDNLEKVIKNN
jgi:hypothetical protein